MTTNEKMYTIKSERGYETEISGRAVRALAECTNAHQAMRVYKTLAPHVPHAKRNEIWQMIDRDGTILEPSPEPKVPADALKEEKQRFFGEVAQYLQDKGYRASVQMDYSGRWMFGRTTAGIVTDAPAILLGVAFAATCEANGLGADDAFEMAPRQHDNMGKDEMIYY